MSRNDQYRQLIADVRTAYRSAQRELKWCDECQEVNLWNCKFRAQSSTCTENEPRSHKDLAPPSRMRGPR